MIPSFTNDILEAAGTWRIEYISWWVSRIEGVIPSFTSWCF
jgi:hypothetical protein